MNTSRSKEEAVLDSKDLSNVVSDGFKTANKAIENQGRIDVNALASEDHQYNKTVDFHQKQIEKCEEILLSANSTPEQKEEARKIKTEHTNLCNKENDDHRRTREIICENVKNWNGIVVGSVVAIASAVVTLAVPKSRGFIKENGAQAIRVLTRK